MKVKLVRVAGRMNKNDRAALTAWESLPHTEADATEACRYYGPRRGQDWRAPPRP